MHCRCTIYSHDVNPSIIDLDKENGHKSVFKSPSTSMFGQNSYQSSESGFLYDENESVGYSSSAKSQSLDKSSSYTKAGSNSSTSNQKYLKIDRNFENSNYSNENYLNKSTLPIEILSNDEESLASYFSSMSSSSVDEEISPPLRTPPFLG